jgi:ankyrin repeat protein
LPFIVPLLEAAPLGILAAMTVAIRLVLLCAVLAGGLSAAAARPLTADEEAVLRTAPPLAEQNRTPAHLERFRAATALARKLGAEGNVDALPVLIEVRQLNVLNEFAGAYRHDATPQLEAIALSHLGDDEVGSRLVAMLRGIRSQALFDALMAALPAGKIDCEYLLRAAASSQVPDADARLTALLPRLHPHPARLLAPRLARGGYQPAQRPLIELLGRAAVDNRSTVSGIATHVSYYPGTEGINAVARKLIDVARLPDDSAPLKPGLIYSVRLDDIPQDGLLCSTPMLRIQEPLRNARGREMSALVHVLRHAPTDAVLDRSLLGPDALRPFSESERAAVQAMLQDRERSEARVRDATPENLLEAIQRLELRLVRAYLARGLDVNRPTATGERPLVYAARTLRPEALELLLEAGADPNLANAAPDREEDTALHGVSRHGGQVGPVIEAGVRTMKALLAKGADPRARNRQRGTALQYAAAQRPELAVMLIEAGADVRAADATGRTPLHAAAQGGQLALARTLIDRGADVNAEEGGGLTPLLIARDQKYGDMEQLLASRGGRVNQVYYLKREAAIRLYQQLRGTGH